MNRMPVNRLKSTYQRNMLIGQAVSIMAVLVYCILFLESPFRGSGKDTIIKEYLYFRDSKLRSDLKTAGKKNIGGWPIRQRDGFLGFNVEFIFCDDNNHPVEITREPDIYIPDKPYLDPALLSFSEIDGDGNALYISQNTEYIHEPGKMKPAMNHDVIILDKPDPEYPAVAKGAGIEGETNILIYIDSTGNIGPFPLQTDNGDITIVNYYILSEEPKDWFFAKNLLKVLNKWRFCPRIESGKRVGAYLKVKYIYCLGINCKQENLQRISANVIGNNE